MKAVLQDGPGEKLYIEDIPIPEPGPGEILIKMNFSPINPSDLSLLQGTYALKPEYPIIPGIEGSGTVIKEGGGILAKSRLGKRVACTASADKGGTWAEYMLTSANRAIPLGRNIDDEQGAMLMVNPLTAVSFMEIAHRYKAGAIVNNAAASALGKMLIYLCRKNNLPLINIVSRESQSTIIKEIGAEYILISDSADFEKELATITRKLDARLIFDAVGGKQTKILLQNSPHGSKIIPYAKLSEEDINIDPRLLIQHNKKLEGFYLGNYVSSKSLLQNLKTINRVKKMLTDNLDISISKKYPLSEVNQAIDFYRDNMSSGKVLLQS